MHYIQYMLGHSSVTTTEKYYARFSPRSAQRAVRAFVSMIGPKFAWMGAFAVLVTAGIMFYYSVVTGWTFRFAAAAVTGELPDDRLGEFWGGFSQSAWPVLTHALAIGLAVFVVSRGVNFIERVAKVLMPTLIVLLLVLTVRAMTLPGASAHKAAYPRVAAKLRTMFLNHSS